MPTIDEEIYLSNKNAKSKDGPMVVKLNDDRVTDVEAYLPIARALPLMR
jgi:hypothetical protein